MTSIERFLAETHGLPQGMNTMQLVDYVVSEGWWNEFLDYLDNKEIRKISNVA
jgi:N-glycosylase/DNA lyase